MDTQENPQVLLHSRSRKWLGSDLQYCRVKEMLVRFFASRELGAQSDELADRVFDSIEKRLIADATFADRFEGPPGPWIWGVARKVLAKARQPRKIYIVPEPADPRENELRHECLERCLAGLIDRHRELILEYYQYNEGKKIPHRKRLAKRMGLTLNALRIRACKVRKPLQRCVSRCLAAGGSGDDPIGRWDLAEDLT